MKPELKAIEPSDGEIESARRVLPVFSGPRLLAMRELRGWSQKDVAAAAGITSSALSQAERVDGTTPTAANLARLAAVYQVAPDAFVAKPEPTQAMQLQFRHLRRTPKREQLAAKRMVDAVEEIVSYLGNHVQFPDPFAFTYSIDPTLPIDEVSQQIETAALETRDALGLDRSEAVGSRLIEILEASGVAVVRDSDTSADIDAYSAVVGGLPIIVLDGASTLAWDRDNFNLAHELGHLVMHQGSEQVGARTIEAQAHRFAGAFLSPAEVIRPLLPAGLDWTTYLALKRERGMSMAALVRRAKDLGVISDATYTRAMKQRSASGWQRVEPGSQDRLPPTPRYLSRAASIARMTPHELAMRVHLPVDVVERILGSDRPSLTD